MPRSSFFPDTSNTITIQDKQEAEKQRVRQEAEARQQRTAEGLSKRKKLRGQFFKKTKSGQPVMKHRIANLLTKL